MTVAAATLNDRQRTYLLAAVFAVDQELESEMRSIPYRPFQQRPKASEWRWLEYSEPEPLLSWPGSRLWHAIKRSSKIDQGTASTFAALADRGLIQVNWHGTNALAARADHSSD